jgi:hypothetical protein
METDDFLDESELLPDDVLDRLAEELPDGCMYCRVRDEGDSLLVEME